MGRGAGALALTNHVEIRFAIRMRAHGLTQETVAIDRLPCGVKKPAEWTCDEKLAELLPPGHDRPLSSAVPPANSVPRTRPSFARARARAVCSIARSVGVSRSARTKACSVRGGPSSTCHMVRAR
ncbi:DddA-like double-stranded DNA deaminase toxin [Allokutzneria albata]|uniref:DddA-like double-stranded DNA deaminase toxin n=1 Tax=Allokutzneria albata TaxID=211114 RepID=UPI0012DE1903